MPSSKRFGRSTPPFHPDKLVHGVGRASSLVDVVAGVLAFCALTTMLVVITLQIVFRVFFQALPWSEELSRYLLVWTTFLGATMAYRRGVHIAVTFLVNSLPALLGRMVRIAGILVSLIFFGTAMFYAVRYMQLQSFQVTASLRLPMPYVYAVMPAAFGVMILHGLHALLLEIFPEHRPPAVNVTIRHEPIPVNPPADPSEPVARRTSGSSCGCGD
ncbi:TRAP transporter small permease [Desulfonatronum sp. SC1]|uniref:TRAP transporter small permease n=1 Tax=Desulfonatronum sp. SC1 TaxID=2109626 RepID=UPI000D2FA3E0|nr:TRAP transporter small permease [Desulfonatronum sp. SC1]PTN31775.1 TRAP transporter small permease [Desulfonatronum sp. SC1]